MSSDIRSASVFDVAEITRKSKVKQKSDIATFVRELRHALDLTQEEFAAKLGVAFPTVNRWENGRVKPSPLGLKQLTGLLGSMGKRGKTLRARYFPAKVDE